MIREVQRSELPAILQLWLESTTWGHPFIKSSYWRDCIPLVRDAYLANAQNWVWEEDGKLLGFVSIMEGGLSKKSTGDRFLPCAGFSHCRLRMAG